MPGRTRSPERPRTPRRAEPDDTEQDQQDDTDSDASDSAEEPEQEQDDVGGEESEGEGDGDDEGGEGAPDQDQNGQVSGSVRSHHGGEDRPDTTYTLKPLENATAEQWLGSNNDPDVLLSVPNLGIDRIYLGVDNVRAHVELHAKVLDLLELHVGADVSIDKVELEIDNVRVQAMLKVKLDKVAEIVDRLLQTIDKHPEILTALTGGLGEGVRNALSKEDRAITQGGEHLEKRDDSREQIEGDVDQDEPQDSDSGDQESDDDSEGNELSDSENDEDGDSASSSSSRKRR
jgi:hypothetical protein